VLLSTARVAGWVVILVFMIFGCQVFAVSSAVPLDRAPIHRERAQQTGQVWITAPNKLVSILSILLCQCSFFIALIIWFFILCSP
jgi:hypothetical protein